VGDGLTYRKLWSVIVVGSAVLLLRYAILDAGQNAHQLERFAADLLLPVGWLLIAAGVALTIVEWSLRSHGHSLGGVGGYVSRVRPIVANPFAQGVVFAAIVLLWSAAVGEAGPYMPVGALLALGAWLWIRNQLALGGLQAALDRSLAQNFLTLQALVTKPPDVVLETTVVEKEPDDYQWLKSVKKRSHDRSHDWITSVAEREFRLQGWLITKDVLKPRFVLEGNFLNSSISRVEIARAEGHITIDGAGYLDNPLAEMTESPSGYPHHSFRMRFVFELTHESSVTRLTQLRETNATFQIKVDGLRVYFRAPDDLEAPEGCLRMKGTLLVPISK
jgi:hypothetical protein